MSNPPWFQLLKWEDLGGAPHFGFWTVGRTKSINVTLKAENKCVVSVFSWFCCGVAVQ